MNYGLARKKFFNAVHVAIEASYDLDLADNAHLIIIERLKSCFEAVEKFEGKRRRKKMGLDDE